MKKKYVVDLNIARSAQTLKDDHGNDSTHCARLLTELIGRCHSLVVCIEIHRGYSDLADELEDSQEAQGPNIFGLASVAWTVEGKWIPVPGPAPVLGEDVVKDDDRVLLRLAVAHGAHIITTDTPLREAIRESGILEPYGLNVLSVEEAIQDVLQEP